MGGGGLVDLMGGGGLLDLSGGGLSDLIRSLEPLGDLLDSILDPPGDRGDRERGRRCGGDKGLDFRGFAPRSEPRPWPLPLSKCGGVKIHRVTSYERKLF